MYGLNKRLPSYWLLRPGKHITIARYCIKYLLSANTDIHKCDNVKKTISYSIYFNIFWRLANLLR